MASKVVYCSAWYILKASLSLPLGLYSEPGVSPLPIATPEYQGIVLALKSGVPEAQENGNDSSEGNVLRPGLGKNYH